MASINVAGVLTPPASLAAPSQHASMLPPPRRRPLKPGGAKESALIFSWDRTIRNIQKRVDERVPSRKTKLASGEDGGYSAFHEVAKDLNALLDAIWVSGSLSLQMAYLLNLAVLYTEFLPRFPSTDRSTQATFQLASKLDEAFSTLLIGQDPATGEALPGFDHGSGISTTYKVRLKCVVDRSRLVVARVLSGPRMEDEESDVGESMDTDAQSQATPPRDTVRFEGFDDDDDDDEYEEWENWNIGNIYVKTIVELGAVLGGPPIGIITDN